MKEIFLTAVLSLILSSCGKEKKEEVVLKKTSFVVYLDAIYEKNDSTFLNIYDKEGRDLPSIKTFVNVKGSSSAQRIVYVIKENADFSNICFSFSTNKEQNTLQIKGITIKNNDNIIIGSPGDHWDYYFQNNDQIILDFKTGIHKIKHDQAYCAGLAGNDLLKSLIAKEFE